MLHASTQTLILKLRELTAKGDIAWREDGGVLAFATEGYVVEIAETPIRLRLLQEDGRELERAEAAELAAASHEEHTFAEHIAMMANQARRHARGTERAIAQILSSLSAPPRPEPDAPAFSTRGGAESEAAMAAAVADMAARLSAPPQTMAADNPGPATEVKPVPPAWPDPPAWKPPVPSLERPARPLRTARTHAMFGNIATFVRPMRNGHGRKLDMKVTSAGLVVPMDLQAPTDPPRPNSPRPNSPRPDSPRPDSPRTARSQPAPPAPVNRASADGYRPWS